MATKLLFSFVLLAFLLAGVPACGGSDSPDALAPDPGRSTDVETTIRASAGTPGTGASGDPTPVASAPRPAQPTMGGFAQKPSATTSLTSTPTASTGESPSAVAKTAPIAKSPSASSPEPTPTPAVPPEERDRAALTAFYEATGGDSWKLNRRWLSDEPLSEWHGVTTDGEGAVQTLLLPDNRLSGEIPPEFGNLVSLRELDLSGNQLIGCIPVEIYPPYGGKLHKMPAGNFGTLTACPEPDRENLAALFTAMGLEEHPGPLGTWPGVSTDQSGYVKVLDFKSQDFMEHRRDFVVFPLVQEVTRFSELQALTMRASGQLFPELSQLSGLRWLELSGFGGSPRDDGRSGLTGKIPPELGDLADLWYLGLYGNYLSGEVPGELGQLTALGYLHLNRNQLSGEIPAELENLSNLTSVRLHKNRLSGCTPPNWPAGGLTPCSSASAPISERQSTQEYRALAALYEDAGGTGWDRGTNMNWLSDKPLEEWAGVTTDENGYVVDLVQRHLHGRLPAELGDLTHLRSLSLEGGLTGEIPGEVGNLSHLRKLTISGTNTPGPIPLELLSLPNLKYLNLRNNAFTGPIPGEIGRLSGLQELDLSGNHRLGGNVPAELWDLPSLARVRLDQIDGCVPAELRGQLIPLFEENRRLPFC